MPSFKSKQAVAVKSRAMIARKQPGTAPQCSPIHRIVQEIKRHPELGERLAIEAGIVTPTGRLTKSYRG